MAVVAVGDFDPEEIEARIKQTFGGLARSEHVRPDPDLSAEPTPEHAVVIADPEISRTSAEIDVRIAHAEDNTYGGAYVVNPSGGLLSKGHPLGATGLAQCTELVWQLRGQAEKRQVEGARIALQHNLGLGGACVMTLYRAD